MTNHQEDTRELTAAHITPSKGGVMRTVVNIPINSGRPKIRCPNFNEELRKYIEGVPDVYIPNYSLLWTCTNPGWGNADRSECLWL